MIKAIVLCVCSLIILLYACNQEPNVDPQPVPNKYEILYDSDSGECNVVKRSDNGLVSESLFNSTIMNECYKYTMENEVK